MLKANVYHYDGVLGFDFDAVKAQRAWRGLKFPFQFVAEVTVDLPEDTPRETILEKVFELTQNLDRPWVANKEVAPSAKALCGCRSTSVGDVIILDTDLVYGWVVAPVGFQKV